MAFTPSTVVKLLSGVPLDNSYRNTRDFPTATAQTAYFNSKMVQQFTDFTYQRERSAIRVPAGYDAIASCNYVMYQNSNYTNKWFYAFITEINYLNPTTSEVVIEQDVIQTWLFDYTVRPSFIERETVANDNMFNNTLPESLDYGPMVCTSSQMYDQSDLVIVVAYSPTADIDISPGELRDGVYTGLKYVWYHTTASDIEKLNTLLETFAKAGQLDSVVSLFMIPFEFVTQYQDTFLVQRAFQNVDGYVPRNKKLFCYPYGFLAVNNCLGTEREYRWELFRNPYNIRFLVSFNYNMQVSCNLHPMNYANLENNWDEGIVISEYPICSWRGNVFANWYALNKYSVSQGLGRQLVQLGASSLGLLSGNVAPVAGALGSLSQTYASLKDREEYPYQLKGQAACGTANVKWGRLGFEVKTYSIRKEYAQIIDEFFDMYGYKVNRVDTPNTKSRASWNYIKTNSAVIVGSMPNDHLVKIKQMYDSGITFWHGDYVGDYSRDNSIVNPPPTPVWPDPSDPPTPPTPPAEVWGYPFVGWQNSVTSEWGWRTNPVTGEEQFHQGMDISAPVGTPLLAISAGTVVEVGNNSIRGNYVNVSVSSEIYYRYQHCDTISVAVGDAVTIEEQIATVGQTGQVTGPHLHVEIYVNGGSVNPRDYMQEKS